MNRRLPHRPAPPAPEHLLRSGRATRRIVMAGLGGIAAMFVGATVGLPLLSSFSEAPRRQRFDNHRVIPPLLRARMDLRPPHGRRADGRGTPPAELAAEEALLMLTRAEMRDWTALLDSPAPREIIELRAYFADDIWLSATQSIAVVEPGGARDARLLAAQGGTVWVWAEQLVAAGPGPMGQTADQAELMRRNPDLDLEGPGLLGRLRLGEALILDGNPSGQDGWAFDPATRIATRRSAPRGQPLPPLYTPGMTGPAVAREGRIGSLWFGLVPEDMTITGPVSAQDSSGAFLPPLPAAGPVRLWRGRLRNAPRGDSARHADADVLDAPEPVPGADPLPTGGLLMAGPGQLLLLADPPSILLAQVGRVSGMQEWVRRLRVDGTPLWHIALPTTEEIQAALVEPGRLWLLARPRGLSQDLHAIALTDGRVVRTRHI
jgi:hypothetical protein